MPPPAASTAASSAAEAAAPGPKSPTAKTATKKGPKVPPKSKDKEEVPTQGPNGETIFPPKVPTPWNLTYKLDRKIDTFPDQQQILDAYPGSYVTKFPNMGKIDHPLIRYERIFLEQEALRHLFRAGVRNVMDVGGAVQRASTVVSAINKVEQKRLGSPNPVFVYHSCNPCLTAADAVRNLKHKDFVRKYAELEERVEWCTLQDSKNLSSTDALLWNHSLYYFTAEQVLVSLLKTSLKRGLAITHTFDKSEGTFPGANYVKKDGKVKMNVEGNSFPYMHGDLEWLTSTNAYTATIDGTVYTLCWSLIQSGIYTDMYNFVVIEGVIAADYTKETIVEEETFADDVLKVLHLTRKRPGPFGVFVFTKDDRTEFTVIPTLVKYAKDTCFVAKKPDEASFRQAVGKMRSVEAEKILSQEIRAAEWYSRAFTQSMVVAFLECAFEYNSAQEWVLELMPLLTQMGFGQCAKRELALTEKMTNAILHVSNAVKTVGEACGMDVIKDQYISDTVDVSMVSPKKSTLSDTLLASVGTPPPPPPPLPTVPFGIAACPVLVQAEVDKRVAESKEECKRAVTARKNLVAGTKLYQDTLSTTSIKRFHMCRIRPNGLKRSATPWVFTRRLGPPLLPNTQSTASIASAKIHRLFDGKEHLNYEQKANLDRTWNDMKTHDYLPSDPDIQAGIAMRPLASSRDWLFKQYGRRNDQKAVANLLRGIEERETTGTIHYDYQFFVKKETAPAKGNMNKFRGIFVTDPTYGSLANPFYYQVMKILCDYYHPDNLAGSHTVISAGLTAPVVGKAIGAAIEEHGNGLIIEMDASSYEANQTREHTDCVVEFYKTFNPPKIILDAICKMKDVRVVERVDPEGNRKLSFFREGGMGSGIGDVSLRNSLNTIMARWSLLDSIGYSSYEIISLTFAMILGDDNWVAVPKDARTLKITTEYVRDFFLTTHGWKMKCNVYPIDQYAKSEFCSMYPFQQICPITGEIEWNMSLKPGRFFSKTLLTKTQLERGMDTMQQLKGMVCGAGHFTNGWLMANCLDVLFIRLKDIDLSKFNLDQDFDYQPTYKYSDYPISLPTDGSIAEDCDRYDLTISDIRSALEHFKTCAKEFPTKPLIITAHPAWDRIIDQDVQADEDDFSDDMRLDPSLPDIKDIRYIPKAWYKEGSTGHFPIYDDDEGSSIFGLGLFQG